MAVGNGRCGLREVGRIRSFRGSKSRNKVSVGEPAEGSLPWYSVDRADRAPYRSREPESGPRDIGSISLFRKRNLRVFLTRAGVGLSLLVWRERAIKVGASIVRCRPSGPFPRPVFSVCQFSSAVFLSAAIFGKYNF